MRVAPEPTRPRGAERKSPASRSRDAAAAASEDRSPWVRMFFTLLPVPDMLYKRHAKLELAARRDVVVKATTALYFISLASFVAALVFYTNSANFPEQLFLAGTAEDVDDALAAGFACTPMTPDDCYFTNYSYAECLENVLDVTEANIDFSQLDAWTTGDPSPVTVTYSPFGSKQERKKGLCPWEVQKRGDEVDYSLV